MRHTPAHCRFGDWNVKETDWLNSNPLITSKPVVYLINLNEDKFIKKKSKWLPKVGTLSVHDAGLAKVAVEQLLRTLGYLSACPPWSCCPA